MHAENASENVEKQSTTGNENTNSSAMDINTYME